MILTNKNTIFLPQGYLTLSALNVNFVKQQAKVNRLRENLTSTARLFESVTFDVVAESEVRDIIDSLNENKSAGLDGINAKVLKNLQISHRSFYMSHS
jgi:hypothetical protein